MVKNAIFMIGVPRSGTSIISEALSLHEELGWLSNWLNRFPRLYWLSVLNRLHSVHFLGRFMRGKKKQTEGVGALVMKYLPHSIEAFPAWKAYLGDKFLFDYLNEERATEDEIKRVTRFVELVLAWQGKERFFAKLTGPSRIGFLNSIFERPYYIHIIRDPRAVVSSLLNIGFWKDHGLESPWWRNGLPEEYLKEWSDSGRSPAVLAAIQWKRIIEVSWREKRIAGEDRYIEMRYEDFVTDPHACLSKLFEFVGLSDASAAHAYLDSIGGIKDMNYKFRSQLSSDAVALIERTTKNVAYMAGYEY